MNSFEKKLHAKFLDLPENIAPGFVLRVYKKGQKICDLSHGKTWSYYDLASLTKIFFTVPWMIRSVQEDRIDLLAQYKKSVPWYPHSVVIKDLLSHSAGNTWWVPFYKMIDEQSSLEVRKNLIKQKIKDGGLARRGGPAVYSDIDFLMLGFLLENVYEKQWIELWQDLRDEIFKSDELFFNVNNQTSKDIKQFAPTEDCPWRKRVLQGEVHDENTWSLQGVAPHAGLFGSVEAVGQWSLWWRDHFYGHQESWASSLLFQRFAQRSFPAKKGDWALGLMMPTKGSASCGKHFSPQSVGHTGFTGTSFWFDPVKDVMVILLSNRIHPHRQNEAFRKYRPLIHDEVMQAIGDIK